MADEQATLRLGRRERESQARRLARENRATADRFRAVELYRAGASIETAAKEIGRAQFFVWDALSRAGIKRRPGGRPKGSERPERRIAAHVMDAAVERYLAGNSAKEIGNEGTVSKTTLLRELRRRGISIRTKYGRGLAYEGTELIVAAYAQGKSLARVAAEFGCSKRTVLRYVQQAGVETRPVERTTDHGRIIALYRDGMSARNTAAEIGCTVPHVFLVLRRNGISPRRAQGRASAVDVAEAIRLYRSGSPPEVIGQMFGVSHGTVHSVLHAAGVATPARVMRLDYLSPHAGPIRPCGTWERAYAQVLDCQVSCGEIEGWRHEPEAIRLPNGRSYWPDFRISLPEGHLEYHEVKGRRWPKGMAKVQAAVALGYPVRVIDRRVLGPLCARFGIEVTL